MISPADVLFLLWGGIGHHFNPIDIDPPYWRVWRLVVPWLLLVLLTLTFLFCPQILVYVI